MTAAVRLRIAEVAAALIVVSLLLPWVVDDGRTLRGIQVGDGQLVLLAAIATIVMIRLGSRLSWFAAGFSAAVLWRQWLETGETLRSMGPLVGALAATTAVVFLVWNMFAEVRASAPGD
ncbi:MAG: hypothetical protein VX287_01380 [Actinomycetota bacterium]|jgi:hypothetical protein|nr:hypothetical protein [Actinomycetota bacterium]